MINYTHLMDAADVSGLEHGKDEEGKFYVIIKGKKIASFDGHAPLAAAMLAPHKDDIEITDDIEPVYHRLPKSGTEAFESPVMPTEEPKAKPKKRTTIRKKKIVR